MKRVIRVLEYFGNDKWVDDTLDKSLLMLGERFAVGSGSIEEIARHERGEEDEKEEKENKSNERMEHKEELDQG